MKSLCVYCGSSPGRQTAYGVAADRLAEAMAERGMRLVYGGASIGLMGRIADAVLANGGEVVGVMPEALMRKEVVHTGLTQLEVTESMHARKLRMAELSDGFVALPGGIGTMEELFEVLTWAQLGLHAKPCALLDVARYYAPLARFLEHAVEEGFVKQAHRDMLIVEQDPALLLERLVAYEPPQVMKWMAPSQT